MSFQINSYLQFQNTPNGKPKVLVEGVDYKYKSNLGLFIPPESWVENLVEVANLSDCRGLFSASIKNTADFKEIIFTELDIVDRGFEKNLLLFYGLHMSYPLFYYSDNDYIDLDIDQPVGKFYDNPAKYSKLLWNCNEQEGWEKVYKLLGIKL